MKLVDIEKEAILRCLVEQNGNRTHTARSLGIAIRTLQRKLKTYEAQGYQFPMPSPKTRGPYGGAPTSPGAAL